MVVSSFFAQKFSPGSLEDVTVDAQQFSPACHACRNLRFATYVCLQSESIWGKELCTFLKTDVYRYGESDRSESA